jgi:hypothetical protein
MENPPNVQEGYVEKEQRGRSVFYRLVRWEDGKRVREYLGTVKSKKFRDYLIGLCVMIRVGILQYNNKILRRLLALLQSDSVAVINARLPKTCRGLFTGKPPESPCF